MNERIRELSMKYAHKMGNSVLYNAEFLEEFAELIIQECAEVASDYDGAHYVGTAIKEHFGVE